MKNFRRFLRVMVCVLIVSVIYVYRNDIADFAYIQQLVEDTDTVSETKHPEVVISDTEGFDFHQFTLEAARIAETGVDTLNLRAQDPKYVPKTRFNKQYLQQKEIENQSNNNELDVSDCKNIHDKTLLTQVDRSRKRFPEQERFVGDIICRTNLERIDAGLPKLQWNLYLQRLAEAHARDLAENVGDVAHLSSEGKDIIQRAQSVGYNFAYVGENVAADFNNPNQVVAQWMSSPAHRANILDEDFVEVGVGLYVNEQGVAYWVEIFGTPI